MAKKKESQQLANPSTSKKPLKVAPPAKKASEAASSAKRKPLEVASSANKKQHLKIPPPELSDDDEDEKTEEEKENETDSSSEEEEDEPKESGKNLETPSASAPIVTATTSTPQSSSESEFESESEGESDSETERDSTKPPPPPAASASPMTKTKRQSEGAASMDVQATAKRAKKESGTETLKTALFQRIWSEEDEIVILQGMIDFKADMGKSPNFENMNKFYETLNKPISFENKTYRQFTEKIASLKRKYVWKRNGVEPTFTKSHDQRYFELAKKIWGSDNDSGVVKTEKMMKVEDDSLKEGDWFKRSFLARALMSLGWEDEALLMESWSIVPKKTKKKIEEKWKLVRAKDNDCVLLKMDLVLEVVSVIAAQVD